ncbi:hypothetical protein [Nocardiopsis oceani]
MRRIREISADTLWRLLAWGGTGAVLGGALVIASALLLSPAEWPGATMLHWGLCGAVVLLAAVWALKGGEQRPVDQYDPNPGEGSGMIRAAAALVLFLAFHVALRELPGARGETGVPDEPEDRVAGEEAVLPDVLVDFASISDLWFMGALALLVGAGALAVGGRPEPLRPATGWPRRQAVLAGLLPVVVLTAFATPTVLERDPAVHTLAGPRTAAGASTAAEPFGQAEAAALEDGDDAAWVWEHPEEGSAGEAEVVATGYGALVVGGQGVWALDSRDGTERWRFQPVGEVLWADASFDGERVAVLYEDAEREEHQQRSLAVLEAGTGKLVGDHRIHRKVDEVLLTTTTFVQVEEDVLSVRAHEQEGTEDEARYAPEAGCRQVGAPVLAGPRILVPEECTPDPEDREGEDDREGDDDREHEVRLLHEDGSPYGGHDVPGPVEEVDAAPDGWAAVVRYGGDDPGVLAFQSRAGDVIAEDLPASAVPLRGERLLYTETEEPEGTEKPEGTEEPEGTDGADRVEYRMVQPQVAVPRGETAEPEALESLVFTAQHPDPDSVIADSGVFAAVHAGDEEPTALLVAEWGSDPVTIPLDTAAEGLSPDGSPFGVALAPETVVVSGLSAGDRAHVVGVGPGPRG